MDRMQPPPNYYGVPYPTPTMDQGMGTPPPYQGTPQPPQPTTMRPQAGAVQPPVEQIPIETIRGQTLEEALKQNMDNNGTDQSLDIHINTFTGKKVRVYCSFPDSSQWHDVILEGRIMFAGNDKLILENPDTKLLTVIVAVYVNYYEVIE